MNENRLFALLLQNDFPLAKEYIDFFFNQIVGARIQPIYGKLNDETKLLFSILKDSVTRITDPNGTGKLMKRDWRNCVFAFINESSFDQSFFDNKGFLKNKEKNEMENLLFNHFKRNHPSWFIRSYVYIVIILVKQNQVITKKDFYIHYWNTNYKFLETSGKNFIFNNVDHVVFATDIQKESDSIEANNRDALDCAKAYLGNLDYHGDTETNFEEICKDIDSGVEYILVSGPARSGKTIIAMRLLDKYKDSVLLLMNYYFYRDLRDAFAYFGQPFPADRIFHHDLKHRDDGGWIDTVTDKHIRIDRSFLIVDEAQRLGVLEPVVLRNGNRTKELDEIRAIINAPRHQHTVFFGDNHQALRPETDQGLSKIHELIRPLSHSEYVYKETIGIPTNVLENIQYILGIEGGQPHSINSFEMHCSATKEAFVSEYLADPTRKKHITMPGLSSNQNCTLEACGSRFVKYKTQFDEEGFRFLFNEEIQKGYMITPFQAISREFESVYVYVTPDYIYDSENGKIAMQPVYKNDYFLNHLYTLMTRGCLKLVIFAESKELNQYFQERIETIKANGDDTSDYQKDSFDFDLFIGYHGTNNPKGSYEQAKILCDYLRARGLAVFLNGHPSKKSEENIGFDETTRIIQKSKKIIVVANDNIPVDENGMLQEKNKNGERNQLFEEIQTFKALYISGERNKQDFRFYYCGTLHSLDTYSFFQKVFLELVSGNPDCVNTNPDSVYRWCDSN